MKILILGSWRDAIAEKFEHETDELGRLLHAHGHTPVIAPGGGIYGAVGIAYRAAGGFNAYGFYPSDEARNAVGEVYTYEPDIKIETNDDYAIRNVNQTQFADAIIAISGTIGTVTDFLIGASDYGIPCAYLMGSSANMDKVLTFEGIKGIPNVYAGNTVAELLAFVETYAENEELLAAVNDPNTDEGGTT